MPYAVVACVTVSPAVMPASRLSSKLTKGSRSRPAPLARRSRRIWWRNAVFPDRREIGSELVLKLGGAFLLLARGLEFLFALPDQIGRRRWRGSGRRRGLRLRGGDDRARQQHPETGSQQT